MLKSNEYNLRIRHHSYHIDEYSTFIATVVDLFYICANIATLGLLGIIRYPTVYYKSPRHSLFRRTNNAKWLWCMDFIGSSNFVHYSNKKYG